MNASYQASLVNRHIRRFTGHIQLRSALASQICDRKWTKPEEKPDIFIQC